MARKHYYILMADIVKSSRFEGRGQLLMKQFRKQVTTVSNHYARKLLSPLTITLGDEFQGVPSDLVEAIQMIVALEEQRVRQQLDFKLRYVVCYGQIDTPLNKKVAHEMLGAGLTKARRLLSEMKSETRTRFNLDLAPRDKQALLKDALVLYFSIADSWKPVDYKLVSAFLDGLEYQEAAKRLGRERTSTLRKERSLQVREYNASKRLLRQLSERR
jgi:hypothetical protein